MINNKKIVFIGNGKSLSDCLHAIIEFNRHYHNYKYDVSAVVLDTHKTNYGSNIKTICETNDILVIDPNNINDKDFMAKLIKFEVDFIISVNNHQIMGKTLLSIPKSGTLNLHNAPLPIYAGLNACTWAIANCEKTHGVTWHFVDEGIDDGDVVAQKIFQLWDDITAIQLIMKCIIEGTLLFKKVLLDIMTDKLNRVQQDLSNRVIYSSKDIPNNGNVDFSWRFDKLNSFINSLNFDPLPNMLSYPRAYYHGKLFFIDKIVRIDNTTGRIGQVMEANSKGTKVSIKDCTILLESIRDHNKKKIEYKDFINVYDIKRGTFLGIQNERKTDCINS
ncbi:MAG: hypothetical protein GY931_20295 [Maribacter sp.]|nr:hypothetical protein [Candidatus Brocadiaceae bacterium]MCP4978493.1 hypothetical protein [Maribacter sp.]